VQILRKLLVWGAVGAGLAVLAVFALPSYRQGEASIAGRTAKDFSVTIDGRPEQLSDLRGKVVVVNFWASWCPPCKEETPALNRLQRHIEGRNGMILGVSADEDQAAYEGFLRTEHVVFPTYRDPSTRGTTSFIALAYGTSTYPETYILDRHGKIARKFIGFQQWDSPEMLAYFDSLLAQP
jgi:thiol-disulfide isomerase/thioredoxin